MFKNVRRENISAPIYTECDNLCRWKVWGYQFWCILPELLDFNTKMSFYFFEVDDLLDEKCSKHVRRENISAPIYAECDHMCRWKVWNHLFWPVVYIAWSWNSTGVPARKQKTSRFKIARYDDSYFVLFGIRRVAVGRVRWVPMQQSTETLCLQNCCSAWKKRQHATWQGLLRCTSLSAKLVECTCLS